MTTHRATLARQSIRGRATSVSINELAARRRAQGESMSSLKDEVAQLRKAWAEKAVPARMALAALEADDGRPAEWRTKERARLVGELAHTRDGMAAAIDEWARGVATQARALRGSEPLMSPAEETASLRDALRAERLAKTFATKRDATATLLPQAWDALQLGNLREARVLMEAAHLAGAFGTQQVDVPLSAALDRIPGPRMEAAKLEADGSALRAGFLADLSGDAAATSEVSARVAVLAGDLEAAQSARRSWASASATAKVRAWASARGDQDASGVVEAPVPAAEG